jgi:hypothetical protein
VLCYAVVQDICKTLLVCTVARKSHGQSSNSSDNLHSNQHDGMTNVHSSSTSDSYAQWHSDAVIVTELAVNTARTARGKGQHTNSTTDNTSTAGSTGSSSAGSSATQAAADTTRRVQRK